jgi:hypothetical protein
MAPDKDLAPRALPLAQQPKIAVELWPEELSIIIAELEQRA